VSVYTVLLIAACGSVMVINRHLQNQPTIPSVGHRLYAVRRQDATVTARPAWVGQSQRDGSPDEPERSPSRDESCSPCVSWVSLTRYRLSQRRYGIVDNNGDFSSVLGDGTGVCRPTTGRYRLQHRGDEVTRTRANRL